MDKLESTRKHTATWYSTLHVNWAQAHVVLQKKIQLEVFLLGRAFHVASQQEKAAYSVP